MASTGGDRWSPFAGLNVLAIYCEAFKNGTGSEGAQPPASLRRGRTECGHREGPGYGGGTPVRCPGCGRGFHGRQARETGT